MNKEILQQELTACENIMASQKDRIDELLLIISNLKDENQRMHDKLK